MVKEEWGTKRTCPNCGERFYDLGKADPVVCINCSHEWVPEPILKTKQPIIVEEKPKEEKSEAEDQVDDEDDLDIDEDDIADVSLDDDDDEEVGAMVDTKLADDGES